MNFPPSSSSFNPLSRIEISSAAIASQNAQGIYVAVHTHIAVVLCHSFSLNVAAINVVVNNLQSFLPQLVENNL